ncbi:hypothetical protein SNEBB_001984 [Seison nebaliae]|nr:hypothetical protein SNEBB_001984 [Seison nebaliae]
MHGRIREKTTEEQLTEKRKKEEEKWQKIKKLRNQLFEMRRQCVYSEESLQLTTKFLLNIVEFQTIWNFRKEILLDLSRQLNEIFSSDEETRKDEQYKLFKLEFDIVSNCLRENPKAYCLWFHRQWCLSQKSMNNLEEIESELKLTKQFIGYDERNFHCWDYRRYLLKEKKKNLLEKINPSKKEEIDIQNVSPKSGIENDNTKINFKLDIKFNEELPNKGVDNGKVREEESEYKIEKNSKDSEKLEELNEKNQKSFLQIIGRDIIKEEIDYMNELISNDFSNYSAWHQKIQMFKQLWNLLEENNCFEYISNLFKLSKTKNEFDTKHIILMKEIDLITDAIYVDPSDESIWNYMKWIVAELSVLNFSLNMNEENEKLSLNLSFQNILQLLEKLNMIEDEKCKHASLMIIELKKILNSDITELYPIYQNLISLDPYRYNYYSEMQKQLTFEN